jgi:L-arabinonolactonase
MTTQSIEVAVDDKAVLGESPIWSVREGVLYWIDTRGQSIYRLDFGSGKRQQWKTPGELRPSAIALRRGGLVLTMKNGVSFLDTASGKIEHVVDPENDPTTRLNDAKVDRDGRFWFGSMEENGTTPTGRLYRLDANRKATALDEGINLPNGPCWSPDDKRMYLGDSPNRTIWVYDFDRAAGTVRNKRPFAKIPANEGMPDGATVDSAGYLWSARVDHAMLVRYAPDGSIERTVSLPVKRPTSVAFGGADLRTLYITTATRGLTDEELKAQPHAGAILAMRVDVPGVPEPEYAG